MDVRGREEGSRYQELDSACEHRDQMDNALICTAHDGRIFRLTRPDSAFQRSRTVQDVPVSMLL